MKFRVKVETMTSKYAATQSEVKAFGEFEEKKEAKKFVREMKKRFELISHAGHVVNYKSQVELFTNF